MKKRSLLLGLGVLPGLWLAMQQVLVPPTTTPATGFAPPGAGSTVFYNPSVGSSLLQSLVAYWNLDETSGTRAKTAGSCSSCDLTAVNAPLASGGAGNYALYGEDAGDKYLSVTNTELRPNTSHVSIAAFQRVNAVGGAPPIYAYGAEFMLLADSTNRTVYSYCGSGGTNAFTASNAWATGAAGLIAGGWDGTNVWAWGNNAARANTAKGTSCVSASGTAYINSRADALTTNHTGPIGPVLVWIGRDISDGELTTLYNSGKGYSCSSLPSALRTNLVACWDLNEASGTRYASTSAGASCTTNCDLSAVNAPGRTAGLVQNGMGMSLNPVATNSYVTNGSITPFTPTDLEVATWAYTGTAIYNVSYRLQTSLPNDVSHARVLGGPSYNCYNYGYDTSISSVSLAYSGENAWHFGTCIFRNSTKKSSVTVDASAETVAASAANNPLGTISKVTLSYYDGTYDARPGIPNDAIGIWSRILTPAERTALYSAGAGVEYPWSSIVDIYDWFNRPQQWADRSLPERQRIIYAQTGVYVPEWAFPSFAVRH